MNRNWQFFKARNFDLNIFNVGNRVWNQGVIDISDVSTTETSLQKYKQNRGKENLGRGSSELKHKVLEEDYKGDRNPHAPASTWVKRVTESMMKQRHKLEYER